MRDLSSRRRISPRPRASWVVETLRVKHASIPVGHSLRAGLAVGACFVIGSLTGQVRNGMWVGLAALLLAAGEREGTYRLNLLIIAVSTPIAAAGYLVGFVNHSPIVALIPAMALVAFGAGLVAGLGPALSVASMQFLVVASIALGVDIDDWWTPLALYLLGGVVYAALLSIQMLIDPRRPQRIALVGLLTALADLARARVVDPDNQHDGGRAARAATTVALRTASSRVSEITGVRGRRSPRWTLDARVIDAAERVEAALVGEFRVSELATAAERIERLTAEVRGAGAPADPDRVQARRSSFLRDRVAGLSDAVHDVAGAPRPAERPVFTSLRRETVLAATRLALCFGIAVAAKVYFPNAHWFWVPLTVCLVMKPDFGSVFSRALLRVIGTLAGIALGTLLLLLAPKGVAIGVAIGLLAACVPWFMMRSYALQAVAITPIVVLLIDQIHAGDGVVNSGGLRLLATVLGGAIVVVFGYLIWPRSRRSWIRRTFSDALAAIAEHLRLAASAVPASELDTTARHGRLIAARRSADVSLSDVRARMERQLSEPPPADTVAARWLGVCAAAEQLADSVTAYAEARRSRNDPNDDDQAVDAAREIAALGSTTVAHRRSTTDPSLTLVVARTAEVQHALDEISGC